MRDRLLVLNGQNVLVAFADRLLLIDKSRQVSVLTVEHPPSDSGKGAPPDAEPNAVESVSLSDTMAVALYRNKTLALWSLEDHKLIAQRIVPKKATSVLLAPSVETSGGVPLVLVADKIGDVRAYVASAALVRESALLLGHTASIITSMDLRVAANNESLLATADRDEKVRLSRFPHTCLIQGFCTGHPKYVSVVRFAGPSRVVSGGGDGHVFVWETPTGAEVSSTVLVEEDSGDKDKATDAAAAAAEETPCPPTDEAAAKDEEQGDKKAKTTMYKWQDERPPIQLLACSPTGHLAAVWVQGAASLVLLSLPSLDRCAAAVSLPCPPLAVSFVDDERLYVTLEAPIYMAAYVVRDKGGRVEEDAEDPVVKSVRAYGVQHALPTQVRLEELDGGDEMKKMVLNRKHAETDEGVEGSKPQDGWKKGKGGKKEQQHKRQRVEEGQK